MDLLSTFHLLEQFVAQRRIRDARTRRTESTERIGFYCVLHFAANGSAVLVTVACAPTKWTGEELIPSTAIHSAEKTPRRRVNGANARGALECFGHSQPLLS